MRRDRMSCSLFSSKFLVKMSYHHNIERSVMILRKKVWKSFYRYATVADVARDLWLTTNSIIIYAVPSVN
jgi:hypothetical protein